MLKAAKVIGHILLLPVDFLMDLMCSLVNLFPGYSELTFPLFPLYEVERRWRLMKQDWNK